MRECVRGIDMAKSSAPISVKHCGSAISAEVTQRTIMQRGNPRKFKINHRFRKERIRSDEERAGKNCSVYYIMRREQ